MTTTQNSTNTTYLILGGARSGKSSYAEKIAKQSDLDVIYIATATVFDDEMKSRVQHHVNDRPSHWETIEEPIELAKVLSKYSAANNIVLVDCLTMWVNNLLMQDDENVVASEVNKLLDTVEQFSGTIIFVSNEVGMGIVPMGELSRKFVDESGRLHQKLAEILDNVLMIVAGLALEVKGKKPF